MPPTLETDDDGNRNMEIASSVDDSLCDGVAPHDTTEDVHENALHLRWSLEHKKTVNKDVCENAQQKKRSIKIQGLTPRPFFHSRLKTSNILLQNTYRKYLPLCVTKRKEKTNSTPPSP